jgi:hypothetical protein
MGPIDFQSNDVRSIDAVSDKYAGVFVRNNYFFGLVKYLRIRLSKYGAPFATFNRLYSLYFPHRQRRKKFYNVDSRVTLRRRHWTSRASTSCRRTSERSCRFWSTTAKEKRRLWIAHSRTRMASKLNESFWRSRKSGLDSFYGACCIRGYQLHFHGQSKLTEVILSKELI